MTLRARLLLGLIAVATVGLVVTGLVTYHELGTYLLDRVDRQLVSAQQPDLFFPNFHGGSDRRAAQMLLPPGTWAQIRSSDGTIVVTNPGSLGNENAPHVPVELTANETITVHGPHFRVLAGPIQSFIVGNPINNQVVQARLIVAIPLDDVDHTLHHLLLLELIVALGVLVAMTGLSWYVVKFGLRPLHQMEETAGAIAAGDLSKRVDIVDEHTEVGRLGIALNEMLIQIERAFDQRAASEERLRQFVADASHELRTPLTSIRGYAELFRRGAADRPEDLAKTMRRIEEEASRMGVLVDDLLLLARLDQGRPFERQPVDLTRITRDAVDDTRAIAPDRLIDYSHNGTVVVPGDEVRLRQVLGNLLQNAVRHTPPDAAVHVRVATDGDDAIIEVRDEGQGMPPEVAERVFERFWRGDPSRTRARGGAGLGLAIVAAIADAHGGRAEVETTPGQGATFRIHLPCHVAATPPPPPADIPIAELEDNS